LHIVEDTVDHLKEWQAITTRYDKTATSYLATVHIAAAMQRITFSDRD
jgi:transposase